MSQETIRFAQTERERLLGLRSLYQTGNYWRTLYGFGPAVILPVGQGKCSKCGNKGNLYFFIHRFLSVTHLCKVCMTTAISSFFKK